MNMRSKAIQGRNQNREVLESPGFIRGEDVKAPSVHCHSCGIAQFLRPGRTKCVRCAQELVSVEKEPDPPQEPEGTQIRCGQDEYIERLGNSLCFALKALRKKAKLSQKQLAERAGFGVRTYISKVENPLGTNRTIPTIHSLEKFAMALNTEPWKIVAAADRAAGRPEQDEWLAWWYEMVPLLRRINPNDRDAFVAAARGLANKKVVANGHVKP